MSQETDDTIQDLSILPSRTPFRRWWWNSFRYSLLNDRYQRLDKFILMNQSLSVLVCCYPLSWNQSTHQEKRKEKNSPVLPKPAKKCEAQMIKSSLSSSSLFWLIINQFFILSTTHSPSFQTSCMTKSSFGHSTTLLPIAVLTNLNVFFNLLRSSSFVTQSKGGRANSKKSKNLYKSVDSGWGEVRRLE